MNNQITEFSQLEEGKEYKIYSSQFEVTNKAVFISHDAPEAKRNITYWQYSERGNKVISKSILWERFKNDRLTINVFALWDSDLKNYIISEIN